MNSTSLLLLLVFLAAGYILQPLALPKLQEIGYGVVAKKEKQKGNNTAKKVTKQLEEPEKTTQDRESKVTDIETELVEIDSVPPEPKPVELTESELLEEMKQSVRSGEVSEFNLDQVKKWVFLGKQEIDGEIYNVGMLLYAAKTIFGEQTREANALFKEGKLIKWIWADNGVEIH